MTQISFPLGDAQQALDQFLNDDAHEHNGRRIGRNILDADGKECLAVILDPKEHRELLDGCQAWEDSQESKDFEDLPAGYRPYIHSPNATTDRLMPTGPLNEPLAHAIFGKPYEELDSNQQMKILGVAISCLLRTTLDADTQGVVPVLMLSHDGDDPQPREFWQLAYKTDVDGLFVRASGNGFFGEEWAIVTGSGYQMFRGWWTKDDAARAAAAIARVLPFVDWMGVDPSTLTIRSKKALADTVRRHHWGGLREDQAEPEPLTAEEAQRPLEKQAAADAAAGDTE